MHICDYLVYKQAFIATPCGVEWKPWTQKFLVRSPHCANFQHVTFDTHCNFASIYVSAAHPCRVEYRFLDCQIECCISLLLVTVTCNFASTAWLTFKVGFSRGLANSTERLFFGTDHFVNIESNIRVKTILLTLPPIL